MLNFLKKKQLESARKKNARKTEFLNYDSINKILIIFNIETWPDIQNVVELLLRDKKEIFLWTVRSRDKASIPIPKKIRVIDHAKDIKWNQSLNPPVIEEFEQVDYDTFIDLTVRSESILEHLLAINKSKFCIGIRGDLTKTKNYDFILHQKEEESLFSTFEQMKIYLNKIK